MFIVRFNTACTGNQLSVGRSFGAEIGESRGQTLWAISAAVMGRAEIIYKGKREFALFFCSTHIKRTDSQNVQDLPSLNINLPTSIELTNAFVPINN